MREEEEVEAKRATVGASRRSRTIDAPCGAVILLACRFVDISAKIQI